MNQFTIYADDGFVWNQKELIAFLISHQGQAIDLNIHEEGSCLESAGVYQLIDAFEFASVSITTDNFVEHSDRYRILHGNRIHRFFTVDNTKTYTQYHNWNHQTVFGGLYNRASWHRIGLASHLYGLSSTLNFRYNPHNKDQRKEFGLQRLFEIDPESVFKFMSCYKSFPTVLEAQDGYTVGASTNRHTDQLAKFYPNFLIDIVSESFVLGRTFYVTEKTIRPMLLKKPFILMGPKCFLIHLRQMGFKTFNDFWDEDYDGYSPQDRYKLILKLIDQLSTKTKLELQTMYSDMSKILDHNYNLLLSKSFSKVVEYIE